MLLSRLTALARKVYYRGVSLTADSHQTTVLDENEVKFYCETPEEYKDVYKFEDNHSEKQVLREVIGAVDRGETFFDVGAKSGLFSAFVGNTVPDTEIVSFEPHPRNAERCETNLRLNEVSGEVRQEVVSDEDGESTLYVKEDSAGTGTHSILDSDGNPTNVSSVRLDTLCDSQEVPEPDVVKIDVEGAEIQVLSGMEGLLREQVPRNVFVEVHHTLLSDEPEKSIYAPLREFGYSLDIINERPKVDHIRATLDE